MAQATDLIINVKMNLVGFRRLKAKIYIVKRFLKFRAFWQKLKSKIFHD